MAAVRSLLFWGIFLVIVFLRCICLYYNLLSGEIFTLRMLLVDVCHDNDSDFGETPEHAALTLIMSPAIVLSSKVHASITVPHYILCKNMLKILLGKGR